MSPSRPYHHGNLRQAVLGGAAVKLREKGAAALSLREIANEIGVSHAAPRRYFPDRQALLDALAVQGFERLGVRLREAGAEGDSAARIRSIADAYIDFTTSESNLVELMFAHKHGADGESISGAAVDAFSPILDLFQNAEMVEDPERTGMVFLATIQGLSGLINCGVIRADQVESLLVDAVARFAQDLGSS